MSKKSSLRTVLKYRHPGVLARFRFQFGLSARESELIFQDMLRFLWLSAQEGEVGKVGMYNHFQIVDEMWHCFVLHSWDYEEFCRKHLGGMLYHVPDPLKPKSRGAVSPADRRRTQRAFNRTMEIVWRELGIAVAKRWFRDYPKKYSEKTIYELQLSAMAA